MQEHEVSVSLLKRTRKEEEKDEKSSANCFNLDVNPEIQFSEGAEDNILKDALPH